ncbi:MAG: O-antigen ligase family protein [Kiritimatiellia bacterium]
MPPERTKKAADAELRHGADGSSQKQIGSLAGRVSGWMALAVVIAAPWLFSAGEPWVWLTLCIVINLAAMLSLVNFYCRPDSLRYAPVWSHAYIAILFFLLFQSMNLSDGLAGRLNPLADAQKVRRQIFEETGLGDLLHKLGFEEQTGASVSLSPAATRRAMYLGIAYIGVLVMFASHHTGVRRARRIAACLVVPAFLLAMFAMAQHFSGARLLYGYYDPGYKGNIFGTFTNRNHYAAFMNMAFGIALALVFSGAAWTNFHKLDSGLARRKWLLQNEGGQMITQSFMAVMIGASACLALSRGAMVSLTASLLIILVFVRLRMRGNHVSGHFIAFFLIVLVSVVMWLGWEGVVRRLGSMVRILSNPFGNARVLALRDTFSLFFAVPVWGCGVGAYRHVFPLFTSPDINVGRWPHAHNDLAELLAEGGVVLMVLAVWVFARLSFRIWREFEDSDSSGRLFVSGLLVGILAMLLHSLLDFSLHRPANPLMFAALVGLAIGGSRPEHDALKIRITRLSPLQRKTRRILTVLGMLFLSVISLMQAGELRGELAAARHRQWGQCALLSRNAEQRLQCIGEAVREGEAVLLSGQGNPEQMLGIAMRSIKWLRDTRLDAKVRIGLADQALLLTASAVRAAPTDYEYWLWLARAAFIGNQPRAAAACLERARQLAPAQQPVYLYLPP